MLPPEQRQHHPVRAIFLITQPAFVALAALLLLVSWRVPTRIRATLLISAANSDVEVPYDRSQSATFSVLRGEIQYADFPKKSPVLLKKPVTLTLTPADTFQVQTLSTDTQQRNFRLHLSGLAEQMERTSNGVTRDLRLTWFDEIKDSPSRMLVMMGVWLLITAIGWYKAYQELKT